MTTLLRIDASLRIQGSYSRALAARLEARWRALHPGGQVLVRDLAASPPPHLELAAFTAFAEPASPRTSASDALLAELGQATDLLISTPLYNFGLPSTLKAWIDQVVRSGRSFERRDDGSYRALLGGGTAYLAVARGDLAEGPDPQDSLVSPLRRALAFIGWSRLEVFEVAGTAAPGAERRLAEALERAEQSFPSSPAPAAAAVERDEREIAQLRAAHAEAIMHGDAEAYGRLCTEDVLLLLPAHAPIEGRAALVQWECALFATTRVARFEKQPLRVTVSGELAYEVGVQRVESERAAVGGLHAGQQKYTHVLRRTPHGWRFAVLTSNPSE
jgi:FMN-dependent NADH-azoreductase